jgi:2'-hydroxyisoflavone reductase
MHLLVLGGTLFLGRHVVESALARGHRVTLFNRGTHAVPWHEVERVIGDRDGGLGALDGRRFDAVVDTSGYVPRLVAASARKLAACVDQYTFVSSISVYRDLSLPGQDEEGEVLTVDDPSNEDFRTHYGALKALSERAVEAAMPGRALHVRPGLIVGPFDTSGRFDWWIRRMAVGGDVLAPGDPRRAIQLIDARDLAGWIVAMAESRRIGTFNATGPDRPLTMGDLLETCRSAAGGDARLTWVDDAFLVDQGVAPFTEMPLWLPPDSAGLLQVDVSKAIGAGLRFRPLADSVRDTAAWLRIRETAPATAVGLTAERERALLAAWHAGETTA